MQYEALPVASGETIHPTTIAIAQRLHLTVDKFLVYWQTVGLKSYKLYHPNREDFRQNYLGMIVFQ
jgi:hypothetical protein